MKLKIVYFLVIFLTLNDLFSSEQLIINITGRISKFVKISSTNIFYNVDLESNYNKESGVLSSSNFLISQISAYSNSQSGYKVFVETLNNFKLVNEDGVSIVYTLNFNGADLVPSNTFFYTVGEGNQLLINSSGGESFEENKLVNSNLFLTTENKENFLIKSENFNDSIKLRIISN